MPNPRGLSGASTSKAASHGADNKKLRNRLSQQAFRERHAAYVRELEARLENINKPDDEKVAELEAENLMLRQQLLDIRVKLESMKATLSGISGTVAAVLTDSTKNEDTESNDSAGQKQASPSSLQSEVENNYLQDKSVVTEAPPKAQISSLAALPAANSMLASQSSVVSSSRETVSSPGFIWPDEIMQDSSSQMDWNDARVMNHSSPYMQLPKVWSHQYQMGAPVYRETLSTLWQTATATDDTDLIITNSSWSDHLCAIRNCFSTPITEKSILTQQIGRFHQAVSIILSLFNSLARPGVLSWYAPTRFYNHIADVVMWQIHPCRETYSRLPTRYRPTALQLMEPHPAVIDWCPFAPVRDRLIASHSANPFIDDIICDMATAYVVETDLCELVNIDGPSTQCYVRVWDVVEAMEGRNKTGRGQAGRSYQLPAPNVDALFDQKAYAQLVFRKLEMDRGIVVYKLDPAFFIKYPELLGDDHDIVASGIPLLPLSQTRLPGPSKLDAQTLTTYKHFSTWSLDVLFRG